MISDMRKSLLTCLAGAVLGLVPLSIDAQNVKLRANCVNGRDSETKMWSTNNIGIYEFTDEVQNKTEWTPLYLSPTCYGNNGAVYVDGYYYTFFGGEAEDENDPGNIGGDIENTPMKVVARKWNTETWEKVDEKVFTTNRGLNFKDMTYDPNEDKVFAIYHDITGSGMDAVDQLRLGVVNLEDYSVTPVSSKGYPVEFVALAAHPNGKLYAIAYSSYETSSFLYEINKKTGEHQLIGNLGHGTRRYGVQTATIDQRTGKMYWAGYMYNIPTNKSGKTKEDVQNMYRTGLYEVDVNTAACTLISEFPWRENLAGMYVVGDIQKLDYDLYVSANFPEMMNVNEPATVTANLKNLGTKSVSGYKVNLYVNGKLVASKSGNEIASKGKGVVEFTYVPSVVDGEAVDMYVDVVYTSDQNPVNNQSDVAKIDVLQLQLPTINLAGMSDETGRVYLAWDAPKTEAIDMVEDFERYAPFVIDNIGNWTLVDGDGGYTAMYNSWEGTYDYAHAGEPFAWQVFNPEAAGFDSFYWAEDTCTYYCQSGKQMLQSMVGAVPNAAGDLISVTNDNWLISPELSGNVQTISFYAKCWTSQVSYFGEYRHYPARFNVYYSTTDKNVSSFYKLNNSPLEAPMWFSEGALSFKLPEGAKYFAIQDVSEYVYDEVDVSGENVEGYVLYIDDIRYQAPGVHVKGYNIYRDGKKLNEQLLTATDYDEFVPVGNHEYVVTAVYEEGESPVSNVFSAVGDPSNPNAIHFVEANSDKENARYDLSGRRVNGAKKGIFIKNGKKFIVK